MEAVHYLVIPAEAGIQRFKKELDSRFRGGDEQNGSIRLECALLEKGKAARWRPFPFRWIDARRDATPSAPHARRRA